MASMGPRALARGNRRTVHLLECRLLASMGPRALARGNLDKLVAVRLKIVLQWGRGLSPAEI